MGKKLKQTQESYFGLVMPTKKKRRGQARTEDKSQHFKLNYSPSASLPRCSGTTAGNKHFLFRLSKLLISATALLVLECICAVGIKQNNTFQPCGATSCSQLQCGSVQVLQEITSTGALLL